MVAPKSMGTFAATVAVVMALSAVINVCLAHAARKSPLQVGFYATSCPTAESLINSATQAKWNVDRTITAGLLRISFHDCFVQVMQQVGPALESRASIRVNPLRGGRPQPLQSLSEREKYRGGRKRHRMVALSLPKIFRCNHSFLKASSILS